MINLGVKDAEMVLTDKRYTRRSDFRQSGPVIRKVLPGIDRHLTGAEQRHEFGVYLLPCPLETPYRRIVES
jgi:hypothetical protein